MSKSTMFFSSAIFSVLLAVSISGCAATSPSLPDPSPVEAIPVETIPASETCDALGAALTISVNASEGLRLEKIDHDTYVMRFTESRAMFKAIAAEPGTNISTALSNLVAHIDSATPTPDGAPFDPTSHDFVDLVGILGGECTAAGSDIIVKAQYGG